jgi:hypothetical protein
MNMDISMKRNLIALSAATALLIGSAHATGLATCESGPKENWQPQEKLEKMLTEKGWKVRRIKEDGGCYEVYGTDDKGERAEAYFHPLTLEPVPTKKPWWKP